MCHITSRIAVTHIVTENRTLVDIIIEKSLMTMTVSIGQETPESLIARQAFHTTRGHHFVLPHQQDLQTWRPVLYCYRHLRYYRLFRLIEVMMQARACRKKLFELTKPYHLLFGALVLLEMSTPHLPLMCIRESRHPYLPL